MPRKFYHSGIALPLMPHALPLFLLGPGVLWRISRFPMLEILPVIVVILAAAAIAFVRWP